MKQQYYTDSMANYLVILCPKESLEGYQYRMLAVNRIRGLLPCSLRTIDGQTYLYYEITSRQSLARRFDHSMISGRDMKNILYSITSMMKSLSDYLLDDTHLFMDPEYIFYDYEMETYWFTYYPEQRDDASLSGLFAYLAEKIDPGASEAAAVIYRLCDLSSNPGFVMREELLDHEYEKAGASEHFDPTASEGQEEFGARDPGMEADEEDEEDLFEADETAVRNHSSKRKAKKARSKTRDTEDRADKRPQRTYIGILIAAIFFLAAAAGCGAAGYFLIVSETTLLALRAGMIACLVISVACAIYGTIYVWKRNRSEDQQSRKKAEEERLNAMMPASDYPAAKGL